MNLVDLQDAFEHGERMHAEHRVRVLIYAHREGLYINVHGPAGENSKILPWHMCHQAKENIAILAINQQIAALEGGAEAAERAQ